MINFLFRDKRLMEKIIYALAGVWRSVVDKRDITFERGGVVMNNDRFMRKELSVASFDSLNDDQKRFVLECASCFHYRNGKPNHDGSAGEIDITPGELNNILAYALKIVWVPDGEGNYTPKMESVL